jgi:hypothetical protein
MKEEIGQNDKEIARGVREWQWEKGISTKEIAKRLGLPLNRVTRLVDGTEHWNRNTRERFAVHLGLMEGKAEDKTGKSVWENVESLTDEKLDSLLRRDLPYHFKF